MAHISRGVEYALHSLLYLRESGAHSPSVQELAEFQQLSRAYVAKLFTRMEKAGLVRSAQGTRGGYRLARSPGAITVLQVVEAIDGQRQLFQCTEIRSNCVLFGDAPPIETTQGICGINRIMQEAQAAMQAHLSSRTLADIGKTVAAKIPVRLIEAGEDWFAQRAEHRTRRNEKGNT